MLTNYISFESLRTQDSACETRFEIECCVTIETVF